MRGAVALGQEVLAVFLGGGIIESFYCVFFNITLSVSLLLVCTIPD